MWMDGWMDKLIGRKWGDKGRGRKGVERAAGEGSEREG